jgi:hypothetical protein
MQEFTYEKWMLTQDAETVSGFDGGDGMSFDSAYRITKPVHLSKLADEVNGGNAFKGMYFRLENDVDLGGVAWTPIGYCTGPFDKREFGGVFDGGGHSVSNFKIEGQEGRIAGFFGYIEYAVVQNMCVRDFEINDGDSAGGLVGYSETSTIAGCYAEGRIKAALSNAGGLVGLACNSRVESSAAEVFINVSDGNAAGGVCGFAYSGTRLANCESRGEVRAKDMASAGGFVGSMKDCAAENCHSRASVMSLDCGISGGFGGALRNCSLDWCTARSSVSSANGEISAQAGGFAGFASSVMTRCAASGNVLKGGEGGSAGGFAGEIARGAAYSCYSRGSVTAEGFVGGFAGAVSCGEGTTAVENCYAAGAVKTKEKMTLSGGFIGYVRRGGGNVTVSKCYSSGELSLGVNGFTSQESAGSVIDCAWRRDDGGANSGISDGRGIQELSTEQFGDGLLFAMMGWSIAEHESAWCYSDEIKPARPHLNGLPVI